MSCGMEGCWPSKVRCFRCMAPKPPVVEERTLLSRGKANLVKRPVQVLATCAPVNPTFRPLRKPTPKAPMPLGPVAPEPFPMVADASAVVQVVQHVRWFGRFGRAVSTGQKQHSSSVSQQAEDGRPGETTAESGRTDPCFGTATGQAEQNARKTGCGVGCVPSSNCGQKHAVGSAASPNVVRCVTTGNSRPRG